MRPATATETVTVDQVRRWLAGAFTAGQIHVVEYVRASCVPDIAAMSLPLVGGIGDDPVEVHPTHAAILCDCGQFLRCPLNEMTVTDGFGG